MKLSIVSPVFNSHEIVRRQLLHYEKMDLPPTVQIIMIDDGSEVPIDFNTNMDNFSYGRTHNRKPWSEHAARNLGASIASGEYLFLIDIDYIVPKETIQNLLEWSGDRMDIRRRFGVLNEDGDIVTDKRTLIEYGLRKRWNRPVVIPGHRSQFVMRKEVFDEIGGYREDLAGTAHPLGGGPGQKFYREWYQQAKLKDWKLADEKADVFMFPVGKFATEPNPHGLFHDLSRQPCET